MHKQQNEYIESPSFIDFTYMIYQHKLLMIVTVVLVVTLGVSYLSMRSERYEYKTVLKLGTKLQGSATYSISNMHELILNINSNFIHEVIQQKTSKNTDVNYNLSAYKLGESINVIVIKGIGLGQYKKQYIEILEGVIAKIQQREDRLFEIHKQSIINRKNLIINSKKRVKAKVKYFEDTLAEIKKHETFLMSQISDRRTLLQNLNKDRAAILGDNGSSTYRNNLLLLNIDVNNTHNFIFALEEKLYINLKKERSQAYNLLDDARRMQVEIEVEAKSQLLDISLELSELKGMSIIEKPNAVEDRARMSKSKFLIVSVIAGLLTGILLVVLMRLLAPNKQNK